MDLRILLEFENRQDQSSRDGFELVPAVDT
jgi:hypothetical protein